MNWKKKKDNPEAQAPEAAAAGKGPAAFWKKNWKLLVPAVCVIVAGGAVRSCAVSGPKTGRRGITSCYRLFGTPT